MNEARECAGIPEEERRVSDTKCRRSTREPWTGETAPESLKGRVAAIHRGSAKQRWCFWWHCPI